MTLTALEIQGAWLFDSPIWKDSRGMFREWFKAEEIRIATGRNFEVEQANISISSAGTLRGIHYSLSPQGQAKWITCIAGAIKDVIVDIRPSSETYGKWIEVNLNGGSGSAVFLSEGLGHGFVALENHTSVVYLTSSPFSPTEEFEINPLDQMIGIDWGLDLSRLNISEKDKYAPTLLERYNEGKLPS